MLEIKSGIQYFNWKQKLAFGTIIGCLHAFLLWILFNVIDDEGQSAAALIFQGVFFGLFMGFGMPLLMKKFPKTFVGKTGEHLKPDLDNNYTIEVTGGANLNIDGKRVNGKLFLTTHDVIFMPIKSKAGISPISISYTDIKKIEKRKEAQFFNTGILLTTNDEEHYSLSLGNRALWMKEIEKRIR